MSMQLYEGKKFTSWTLSRVVEALYDEWNILDPELKKNVIVGGKKVNQISFKGEVTVTLEIVKDKYPSKDSVEIADLLSLSPDPGDLSTYVLNNFSIGMFVSCFPDLVGERLYAIKKDEPWEGSVLQITAQRAKQILQAMLNFESCFHLLLDDEYVLDGTRLDMKSLSIAHHLNQVKAYRLAEIYGHPEKLDEAIRAIKAFALTDELSKQRLEALGAKKPEDAANWLYTPDILNRLRK